MQSLKTQKENMPKCGREQPRRNHRKSMSPNHICDPHRLGKVVPQWDSRRDFENSLAKDAEKTQEAGLGSKDTEKAASKDDDLFKFAEILYKCSLCTTLPCILTSQSAFLRHVKEHHLAMQAAGHQCQNCHLHFQTHSDVQAHLSEAHCHPEPEIPVTVNDASTNISQQLTKLGNSPQPSCYHDDREKRDTEELIRVDDRCCEQDWTHHAMEQSNDSQKNTTDDTDVDTKPQVCANPRLSPSSSTPATLEYHSSNQHPHRGHVLSSGSPTSPPLHSQQTDPSRSPVFGGGNVPEMLHSFPSFTPEFGRYTKLIREGGRIVYFCQVCNVKCQVKAAFQVHCNGVRHHNAVNMVGKNKVQPSSALSLRDSCLRSPLKEVPVVSPQLAAVPRGDHSLMEKMAKFFQDHPDMSAVLNHGNSLLMGDFWGTPVNFSLKDRSGGGKPDSEEGRQPEKDTWSPEKGHAVDGNVCLENSAMSRTGRQECQPNKVKEHCMTKSRTKPGNEATSVLRTSDNSDNRASDPTNPARRKRPAPSASQSDSPCMSESESVPLTGTSSLSSVKSAGNTTCPDIGDTDSAIHHHHHRSDSLEPPSNKRPRRDTAKVCSLHKDVYESSERRRYEEPLVTPAQCDLLCQAVQDIVLRPAQAAKRLTASTLQRHGRVLSANKQREGKYSSQKDDSKDHEDFSDGENTIDIHISANDDTDCASRENASLHDHLSALHIQQQSRTQSTDSSETRTGSGQDLQPETGPKRQQQAGGDTSPRSLNEEADSATQDFNPMIVNVKQEPGCETSTIQGATGNQAPDQALLDMMAKRRHFPVEGGACFFPGMVHSEAWFCPVDTVTGKDSDLPLWGGGAVTLHETDDVTEGSKGQNSEGWKVTKIRDVLRGLIAASGKGSSVSRDVLLYRVSRLLRAPDVQHWGPACNRAVRDLFPHCLAQRKGKFKKTYFFGLALIPAPEEAKGENHVHVDGTSFRPLRDMTQDLEQLLEHLPGLLCWSGQVERGVSRDAVLHVLAARLSEAEVFHWGMQCNKALRMLFPLVLMKRKGKYKTYPFFAGG
ncbi:LOW QUALITY PROTEIN: uncharacterized protein LOC143276068 [Babylonia areolata]|uniref:LOW QUALITY PROTEIN: uncharacterized protein LOC143276068 n=1 Tax=Babylonia areolata TaxID=304850 RepID=UPI003FD4A4AA